MILFLDFSYRNCNEIFRLIIFLRIEDSNENKKYNNGIKNSWRRTSGNEISMLIIVTSTILYINILLILIFWENFFRIQTFEISKSVGETEFFQQSLCSISNLRLFDMEQLVVEMNGKNWRIRSLISHKFID